MNGIFLAVDKAEWVYKDDLAHVVLNATGMMDLSEWHEPVAEWHLTPQFSVGGLAPA